MDWLLQRYGVQFVDITLHSAHFASISVTFEVTLPLNTNQEQVLNNFSGYFSTLLTRFGNYTVRRGNRSLTQVLPAGMTYYDGKFVYEHLLCHTHNH